MRATYIIGHGASSKICSHVAPPPSCPMVWISSKMILRNIQFVAIKIPLAKKNLFILGSQVCASGGDSIMIDNISGTVTRI